MTYAGWALGMGRAEAESLMVDTCTIRRPTGKIVDPNDGTSTTAYDIVYSGKCRFQSDGNWGEPRDIGQDGKVLVRTLLQFPISVTGALVNDEVTVDTCFDPELVGRVLRIRDFRQKTHATMRRAMCIELQG